MYTKIYPKTPVQQQAGQLLLVDSTIVDVLYSLHNEVIPALMEEINRFQKEKEELIMGIQLYTREEACKFLKVSTWMIESLVAKGRLKAIDISEGEKKKLLRFTYQDLKDFTQQAQSTGLSQEEQYQLSTPKRKRKP